MMNLVRTSKTQATIALLGAAGLVLTACGSGDEDKEAVGLTPSTSAAASSIAAATTSQSAIISTEAPAPAPAEQAPAPAPAPAAGQDVTPPQVDAVGGQAADPAQAQAIESLVRNQQNATTLREYMSYIPNHSCQRIMDTQGAFDVSQIPDTPLNEFGPFLEASPSIDSVTDIQVNGNEASAVVTATSGGQTTTATQRFLYEDNQWKFCY